MNIMCLAHLGLFLLALHLVSSQEVPNATDAPMNMTTMSTYTMTPTVMVNVTSKNGCVPLSALPLLPLLLPLALAASLLLGCSL